jgi:hypothetical protein
MTTNLLSSKISLLLCAVLIGVPASTYGESFSQDRITSVHGGFLYPNGVDVAGYTVEHTISHGFYKYYTFGIPSFAAAGISYNKNYKKNGVVATVGVGIGSAGYASIVYQRLFHEKHIIKLGVGYTTGVAYTGVYPAISYEYRFKQSESGILHAGRK